MSARSTRYRDRAVGVLRALVVGLVLLGLGLTGAVAGLFARPPEAAGNDTAAGGAEGASSTVGPSGGPSVKSDRRRVLVVVHWPSAEAATARAAAPAAPTAPVAAPAPAASPSVPQQAPTVSAPPAPAPPAGTTSGSDAG